MNISLSAGMDGEEDIYSKIKGDILACRLLPNSRIFEQELAARLGVSKSPVREALLRLVQEELVEVRPRSGYRVRPVSIREASEIYEMRLMYEEAVVTLAVEHATDQTIEALRAYLPAPERLELESWLRYNRMFHIALANACGNGRLARTTSQFIWQFDRFTHLSAGRLAKASQFQVFIGEHEEIVNALAARDSRKARTLVRRHVGGSRKRTLKALTELPVVVP